MNDSAHSTRVGVHHLEITSADNGRRLDNCLFTHYKDVPKSHIYRVIRSGQVRVNGGRAKPSRRVANGDVIRVPPLSVTAPPLHRVDERKAQQFEQCVIFEDEHYLVLNKPSGEVVHGGSRHNFGVVEISRHLRGDERFPALVHRLDRGTSGCLLLAKSQHSMLAAQSVFRSRGVEKTYLALVVGEWDESLSQVRLPLTVSTQAAGPKVRVDERGGKPAVTDFEIVERFDGCTLLQVMPHSGRMHQIRVHAAASGHPVAGDQRYGDFAANRRLETLGLRQLFLHASRLSLSPMERKYDFESPLPEELTVVLRQLSPLSAKRPPSPAASRHSV